MNGKIGYMPKIPQDCWLLASSGGANPPPLLLFLNSRNRQPNEIFQAHQV